MRFINLLFIFSIIVLTKGQIIIEENKFVKNELKEESNYFKLPISSQANQVMTVEIVYSHPSKYFCTFNKGDDAPLPDNRTNGTDLIQSEELKCGKNKVILNIKDDMKSILFSVFRKENTSEKRNDTIFIKYKVSATAENEKYSLANQTIDLDPDNQDLTIKLGGIKQSDESKDLTNFTAEYNFTLFDKEYLESKYENIYIYSYMDEKENIFLKNLTYKGEETKKDIKVEIEAPTNGEKTQLLLIFAKVGDANEEKTILQYEVREVKVDLPKVAFYIILISFIASVVLTFIALFIYVSITKKDKADSIDKNYKNVDDPRINTSDAHTQDQPKTETEPQENV